MQAIAPDPNELDVVKGVQSRRKAIDEDIQQELETILASDSFRSSKRCQTFLRYVVEEAACSEPGLEIKERTLGITLWNRPADYDTGTDAIVRVKANEVRRRLMNYNLAADISRAVTITLEPGSYVPRIIRNTASSISVPPIAPPSTTASKQRRFFWLVPVLAVVLVSACVTFRSSFFKIGQPATITRFWQPITDRRDILICTASPSAYRRVPFPANKPADSNVALRLREELVRLGAKPRIGKTEDVTRKDLEATPYSLVGGPAMNHWTAELANHYRLEMETVDNRGRIIDSQNPSRFWEETISPDGRPVEDFILITRVLRSDSGQPMISVAGITQKGSMAGGVFLTDESLLQALNRFAPVDWDRKNVQLVLKTKLNHGNASTPEIVSAIFW